MAGAVLKRGLEAAGGYGGDFATVLASRGRLNRADVVFSTVDTVGIPLMLLARGRILRPPFVYAAIGLPERLVQLRSQRTERLYARALGAASRSSPTASTRRTCSSAGFGRGGWRRASSSAVRGGRRDVPADRCVSRVLDVVSVGADPHRDFELLLAVARAMPETGFLAVTTADRARALAGRPNNVAVETDLPFDEMRLRLERARAVALPVRENSYSGATTVLLQAMALAKPVVVTQTAAIATGYGLEDGRNVRLVAPSDAVGFGAALEGVLTDDAPARELGLQARATVESRLTWERYVSRLADLLEAARR